MTRSGSKSRMLPYRGSTMHNIKTHRLLLGCMGAAGDQYTPESCLPELKRTLRKQFTMVQSLSTWRGFDQGGHQAGAKIPLRPDQLRQQWGESLSLSNWSETMTDDQYDHDMYLQTHAIMNPRLFTDKPYAIYLGMTHEMMMDLDSSAAYFTEEEKQQWYLHERLIFEGARWLFARTAACALSLHEQYGQPLSKIHVVGAGATGDDEPVQKVQQEPVVAFVARRYLPDQLIRAMTCFRLMKARHASLIMKVISPDTENLVQGDGIEYLGPLQDHNHMLELMSESTLLLNCQVDDPMAIITLEAMNKGVAIITGVGHTSSEFTEDGISALQVNPKDPMEMARAANFILKDPARIKRMGQAGQERVKKTFNWTSVVKRMKRVMQP